jgi:hypothetical protein
VLEAIITAVGEHVEEKGDLCRVLIEARTQAAYVDAVAERVRSPEAGALASMPRLVEASNASLREVGLELGGEPSVPAASHPWWHRHEQRLLLWRSTLTTRVGQSRTCPFRSIAISHQVILVARRIQHDTYETLASRIRYA